MEGENVAVHAIKVLIADDHPLIVEGLVSALKRHGIECVGEALKASEVLPKFKASRPDVVLLDVRFGEGQPSGLEVARDLLARHPDARIAFYSQFDQDELVKEAYRLGGMSFVTKNAPVDVLANAIRQVHAGQLFFATDIAQRLALLNVRGDESPQARLDARELEVFKRMALGLTNVEIAEELSLSPKTISNVSQAIKERLGVHRPAEITRLAVRHMLIAP
ncbi:response regulator transcription factor [Caldimonas brevitalea]|uniref:Two-component response regulator n=1 Tax=Caldimonas brevitalea TaxID=413882 RepID=A0A0G3BIB6_9BURK|nr:response regulator transcription factor [Caldimonas brevitalea]AKJ27116.1 two-component response regulator [Caldimonas brevitalea]